METNLCRESGTFTSAQSKSVHLVRFEVPEGQDTLALRFDYAPRSCTDVAVNRPLVERAFDTHLSTRKGLSQEEVTQHREALNVDARSQELNNLLNVTLIDPEGVWRGRWDRNPAGDGTLLLSSNAASRGFLPGKINAGEWTAAVECHGVFGKDVNWNLEVAARPELTATERESLSLPTVKSSELSGSKRRSGPGWYVGEMHSHSVHSDGNWEVPELAARVAKTGAEFLCLSDHNTMSGHLAHGSGADLPLTLVRSCELTTFYGHHPIYGVQDAVPWHRGGKVMPLAETAPLVRAQNGIMGVAHPFVPGDPLCTGCRKPEDLDPKDFDTIEVWYRRWDSPGVDNEAALALWDEYWRDGHRIVAVGARDVHREQQEGPWPGEMPLTAIYAEDNTPDAIVEGLRRGRVVITGGPLLDVELGNGSQTARIGDTVQFSAEPVTLRVTVKNLEPNLELRVLKNGATIHSTSAEELHEFSADGPGYYRVELWNGTRLRALSNHVIWG